MWRFLIAGLSTLGGLVLLLFGSFSDPVATLLDLRLADPVARSPVSRMEAAPLAVATRPIMTAASVDTKVVGINAPLASTEPSAPIATPTVHSWPVDHNGDSSVATTLVAAIHGAKGQAPPHAPLRHAPSAATAQRGRATPAYVTRSQDQGVWLFPPDPTGGGNR
jgi:hypothetical protein